MEHHDRVALVTGGDNPYGIGAAIARAHRRGSRGGAGFPALMPEDRPIFYRDTAPLEAAGLGGHYAVNTRAPTLLMAKFHRRHRARGAT